MKPWELQNNGLERYTTRRVVFNRPFTLGKASEVYPAGVYRVETKEQPMEIGGHTAYVRTGTVLVIPTATGSYCRDVRSHELDEAVSRDTEQGELGQPSENPDRGDAEPKGVLP